MADPKNPRPGEVWERDGEKRAVVWIDRFIHPWSLGVTHTILRYERDGGSYHIEHDKFLRWASSATCIKEAP